MTVQSPATQPAVALKPPAPVVTLSDLTWQGFFAEAKKTPEEYYCLMGRGFFRAATSPNIGHLVTDWIAKHPNAVLVKVFSLGPVLRDKPETLQTYVLVVDGPTTLNEYLVRQGACPGGTMQLPDTQFWGKDSMSAHPWHLTRFVAQKDYEHFLARIEDAEVKAQKEKLGVWKHGVDSDDEPKL